MIRFAILTVCLCLTGNLRAQAEFYLENDNSSKVIELYDGTYLVNGSIDEVGLGGFISKVQPNGEILWEITFDYPPVIGQFSGSFTLSDSLGNIYMTGQTFSFDGWGSIYVLKFNPCGELEWIKIGDYPDYWDSVHGFQFAENGDLLLACDQAHGVLDYNTGEGWPPGKLRMTRLSTDGDTIWYDKFYPRGCGACAIEELSASKDNGALMTLDDYISFEGSPSYIRPVIVKYDENGEVEWTNFFGIEEGFIGNGPCVVELKSGNIVAIFAVRSLGISYYFKPYYYKLNPQGEVLEHFMLDIDTTLAYDGFNLALLNDSTMAFTLSPSTPTSSEINDYHFQLLTLDTTGQVLGTYTDSANFFTCRGLEVTENQEILVALTEKIGNAKDILVKRINPQTMQLAEFPPNITDYDYLCPYPIESYDINLKTSSLSIQNGIAVQFGPNPASEGFYIRWRGNNLSGVLNFSLYDINGTKLKEQSYKANSPEQWINTTTLTTGVYVWSLEYDGQVISKQKIIVE